MRVVERALVIDLDGDSLLLSVRDGGEVLLSHELPLSPRPCLEDVARRIRALGPAVAILSSATARAVAELANDFDARPRSAPDVTRVAVHRLRAILSRFRPPAMTEVGVAAAALDSAMELLGIESARVLQQGLSARL